MTVSQVLNLNVYRFQFFGVFSIFHCFAVEIGLSSMMYTTSEAEGKVEVCVSVTGGSLKENLTVNFNTIDGSAKGEKSGFCTEELHYFCLKSLAHIIIAVVYWSHLNALDYRRTLYLIVVNTTL